ncbi:MULTISPECIES: oxidative stress defense protein [Vibrio]|uniref:Oxidative stress defense protein n=1 Tax=Vibrio algicola TaxID=2662262 RepID=A0A5Q0TCJ4_9VIBR|nr:MULTISPECIES: oxidative stress defense protein [Vibrio]MBD1576258.1 oxidative stress defense protein [Vibrio sp. S11_S32]
MKMYRRVVLLLSLSVFSAMSLADGAVSHAILSTTGFGQVVAKPDMAEFTVAIQAQRSQAKTAKQAVDKIVTQFVAALDEQGIKRADIASGNLRLAPQYQYEKDKKPELSGYQASRHITVSVYQLDKLNQYLDIALKSGINRVDGIQLKTQNEAKYKQQARQAAIEDAKQKAKDLAKGFDTQLLGIRSIHYRGDMTAPVGAKVMMMKSRTSDQSYQDQSMLIRDQVDVVYKIKQ